MSKVLTPEELEVEFVRLNATCESKGMTTRQLCEAWKCGAAKARRRLQWAHDKGYLRHGKQTHVGYNGVPSKVDCYWFEFPKGKRKK